MLERLTDKDREFIKQQVTAGYYASEIEVVRDAVRRLREKTQEAHLLQLRTMALEGHNQALRGEGAYYEAPLMDKFLQDAISNSGNGKTVTRDVKP